MKKLIIAVLAFILAIGVLPTAANAACYGVPFDPGFCD